MQDYLEDLQTKHRQAYMAPAAAYGAQQAVIAHDIYRMICEKYPDANPLLMGDAMWLAMQMVVGPCKAADVMRHASILPAK